MTRKQKKMLTRILLSAAMMIVLHFVPAGGWVRFALYMVPYLLIGYDILWSAAIGIFNGQVFDENFLMAAATVGAMALGLSGTGEYTEGVAVMLFYQIGELFQSYAVGKSRRSIAQLMDIRPDSANLLIDGLPVETDPEEVAPGSRILIQPGERVPLDGIVLEGESVLNSAALTGESRPEEVRPGDTVLSGCINMTGVLTVETTRPYAESTVARILDLVENASSRKSRSEAFISRFARVYTPAVCIGALALAVLPPLVALLMGQTAAWGMWVYRALTFLVISCPCALVISIPLSFFAGIGAAGARGILVKGSNYLEALASVDRVVFDKTGTLTQGVFRVQTVKNNTRPAAGLLELAALAECASSHPISKSLRAACGQEPDRSRVRDIQEISGFGVSALVDDTPVLVGSAALLEQHGITAPPCESAGTVVHVAAAGVYAGAILIADEVKPQSAEAIAMLKRAGVRRTVMLTGDRPAAAGEIAAALGLDAYYARLLPGDKVDRVEELLAQPGRKLAFVGDGINDAPVLSRADIGIAMGAMGSDAAIEAADVVLMDDDPRKIAEAIRLARTCMAIVYENIVFALGIKGICLLLGALGFANMGLAIFADVGVMVLAVLNAVRILWQRK
ncbi:MAG: cadmium-translocating P-type ATPase [Clostridia bacterium]|nr:cadmium-translocating P-type ATPase [Clostridia bacterium]